MAASLLVTTNALVVDYMGAKGGPRSMEGFDASLLTGLVAQVSQLIETSLHRRLLIVERTEQFSVRRLQSILGLDAYPIDVSGPTVELRESQARIFTGSTSIIPAADYYVDANSGTLLLDGQFLGGQGSVQLQWTGGVALTQGALATAMPDLVEAANLWVSELWDRRDTHTTRSRAGREGSPGDSMMSLFEPPPFVEAVLTRHRASRMSRV